MLAKTSFPPLAHYGGDEGQEGPPDRAFMVISVERQRSVYARAPFIQDNNFVENFSADIW